MTPEERNAGNPFAAAAHVTTVTGVPVMPSGLAAGDHGRIQFNSQPHHPHHHVATAAAGAPSALPILPPVVQTFGGGGGLHKPNPAVTHSARKHPATTLDSLDRVMILKTLNPGFQRLLNVQLVRPMLVPLRFGGGGGGGGGGGMLHAAYTGGGVQAAYGNQYGGGHVAHSMHVAMPVHMQPPFNGQSQNQHPSNHLDKCCEDDCCCPVGLRTSYKSS
jgi:hypothetical protein